MTIIPFPLAAGVGDRFLALLARHGIDPGIGSAYDDELLSFTQLIDIWKAPDLSPHADTLATAAGVADFGAKVLSVEPQPEFQNFIPHLDRIGRSKLHGSVLQNMDVASDTARKMTELYFACLALHVGNNVRLDHPDHAKGDNPDVMFEATPANGDPILDWALAIKSVNTQHGQTIYERILEGARQIDRSAAGRGMVVINLRDSLDHDQFRNPANAFASGNDAINAFSAHVKSFTALADLNRPTSDWDKVFAGKTVAPILFLGQTMAFVRTSYRAETPTPLRMLWAWHCKRNVDPWALTLAGAMNDIMQTVNEGIPGAHGRLPR